MKRGYILFNAHVKRANTNKKIKGVSIVEVEGKPLELFGIKMVLHRPIENDKSWKISHYGTGLGVGPSQKIQKEAISGAKKWVERLSKIAKESPENFLKTCIKKYPTINK